MTPSKTSFSRLNSRAAPRVIELVTSAPLSSSITSAPQSSVSMSFTRVSSRANTAPTGPSNAVARS